MAECVWHYPAETLYSKLSLMNNRHIVVCSWSLQPKNPSELISRTKSCGISSIQLALNPLIADEAWSDAESELSQAGLSIMSGMLEATGEDYTSLETIAETGGVRPDGTWEQTWQNAQAVAQKAQSMNLGLVTFHAGFFPEDACQERTKMIERLRQILTCFDDCGVNLAFETGQENARNLITVLEELNHPTLGVNFDPANMILYGQGDPIDAVHLLAPWIKQVHIKDAKHAEVVGTWGIEVPAGTGDFCWKTFLSCVPDGINLVIEREGGDQRVEDVQQALGMLRELGECE